MLYAVTSLLQPKWSSDLKYSPCPPARDWGSRVSGLVYCDLVEKILRKKEIFSIVNVFVDIKTSSQNRNLNSLDVKKYWISHKNMSKRAYGK